MSKPQPRDVFDDPTTHRSFLTQASDNNFEGQHFDRKQIGEVGADPARLSRQVDGIRTHVTETISAYANKNVEGGLLVLGIASDGSVKGINHLSEQQKSSITDFDSLLHHHAAEAKHCDCSDDTGCDNEICLILTPHTDHSICETPGRNPKAWVRNGPQNIPMTQEMRDRIKVAKGIVDFESTPCSPFDPDDVDQDVVSEFRKVFHPGHTSSFSTQRLLYEAGAIVRSGEDYLTAVVGN